MSDYLSQPGEGGFTDEDEPTYKIIRFNQDARVPREVIDTGLSFQEARDHCNDPDSSGVGWFHGFERES